MLMRIEFVMDDVAWQAVKDRVAKIIPVPPTVRA
jgi:hypothetical protein